MVMLGNCIQELSDKICAQEQLKNPPVILGFRLIDGPWEKTKFLDVETIDKTYSALLIKEQAGLKMVAPFKVIKKDSKK